MNQRFVWLSGLVLCVPWWSADAAPAQEELPAAILGFQEQGRGVREMGPKVEGLLFAHLAAESGLWLVERTELDRALQEAELRLSGMVNPAQATQVGQLTGAKILITGSVIEVDQSVILVAKIIGTETSRVLGRTVTGAMRDDLAPLVKELAAQVADTIRNDAASLVAKPESRDDRIEALRVALGDGTRPAVRIEIAERHVGQATIDPAAETELILMSRETGFRVVDGALGDAGDADVLITGEGFSEFAMRRGNLVSVKARLEVKAVDRDSGEVIAADRQTAVRVDVAEQLAGKSALQEAAAQIAERLLPKLAGR